MPLSLDQMKQRIGEGKSVLYKNRIISSVDKLPTAVQMATTDEEKQKASADLDAQIANLQKQKDSLGGSTDSKMDGARTGSPPPTDSDDTQEELMKHTRAELLEKAKEAGVTVEESATKAEITQAILDGGK